MKKRVFFQYAIRSLIPAWRFFNETDGSFSLHLRPCGSSDSEWIRIDPYLKLRWFHLFFNPEGLSIHAFHNFLKLVHQDPSNQDLQSMLRDLATRLGKDSFPGYDEFDFKIAVEGS